MRTMPMIYRARWSFVGHTRSLLDTGRCLARFGEQAARLLVPDLDWSARVQAHSDLEVADRWETSHVVDLCGGAGARGCARLMAGGRGKRVAGASTLTLETLRPLTFIEINSHCNVEHWDVCGLGVELSVLDAMRAALEAELGATGEVFVGERRGFSRGPREIASTESQDEAQLWAADLDEAGLASSVTERGSRFAVAVTESRVQTFERLTEARVTLGEVLAEAGHEDWRARGDELLAQLTHSSSS